jgi:hypothetical protein
MALAHLQVGLELPVEHPPALSVPRLQGLEHRRQVPVALAGLVGLDRRQQAVDLDQQLPSEARVRPQHLAPQLPRGTRMCSVSRRPPSSGPLRTKDSSLNPSARQVRSRRRLPRAIWSQTTQTIHSEAETREASMWVRLEQGARNRGPKGGGKFG